ncbi:site-specific integrase [Microvirga sp. 3-52]|uniref:tyrosine-type recombinase/integrase n=1 Tax=Microvirga sp. 3-52 TaxID=2792425 RepID=UPI001AD0B63F|nr:site-specific integrase [Microvirga sp. 3-52]MBO1903986.1 site-specific integrase [Microvirga sp. 3-52]MBS7451600.1 site-specific integrase [Microvirga sp. 3-52]
MAARSSSDMPRKYPRYCTEDEDRHGNLRIYFRRPGQKKIRLKGIPWSESFMEAYRLALEGKTEANAAAKRSKAKQGSFRGVAEEYFGSAFFFDRCPSPRTRQVRRRELEALYEKAGDEPITSITKRVVLKAMDRRKDKPEAANTFLKALRGLFAFALDREYVTVDPTTDVAKLQSRNPEGWHTWSVDEVRQYEQRHPIGTKGRLAMALLLYTGARRSDVVQLGRQHVRDGWLKFRVYKNHLRKHTEVEIPVLPELQQIIDATPEKGDLTFLISDHGRHWSSGDSFGNRFRDWCNEAGLPHCSPHGLRKAGATIAAENGATERQLMAIYGWSDPKMAAHYTKKANPKRLTKDAMHLIVPHQTENETVPLSGSVDNGGTKTPKKARKNNAI